ncbi:MAG: type 1 fimbrial protein [Metakosakonia sp.]|nr:fimbrial protein [Phytobacter sp.]MBV8872232.1 type 1 fimbrial protein [Phytobacter sp.]
MKKILLVASIASAMSLANVANAATGGTITFNGKISDQTCQVVLNAGNGGTSANGTVTLRTVPKSSLATINSTAGETDFTLDLTGCNSSATAFGVTAYFPDNATNIDTTTSTLKNLETGATAATNVNLELAYKNGNAVPLGKAISDAGYKYTSVEANKTTATMNYVVRYKNTTSTPAGAGLVRGAAIYELAYQ